MGFWGRRDRRCKRSDERRRAGARCHLNNACPLCVCTRHGPECRIMPPKALKHLLWTAPMTAKSPDKIWALPPPRHPIRRAAPISLFAFKISSETKPRRDAVKDAAGLRVALRPFLWRPTRFPYLRGQGKDSLPRACPVRVPRVTLHADAPGSIFLTKKATRGWCSRRGKELWFQTHHTPSASVRQSGLIPCSGFPWPFVSMYSSFLAWHGRPLMTCVSTAAQPPGLTQALGFSHPTLWVSLFSYLHPHTCSAGICYSSDPSTLAAATATTIKQWSILNDWLVNMHVPLLNPQNHTLRHVDFLTPSRGSPVSLRGRPFLLQGHTARQSADARGKANFRGHLLDPQLHQIFTLA